MVLHLRTNTCVIIRGILFYYNFFLNVGFMKIFFSNHGAFDMFFLICSEVCYHQCEVKINGIID